MGRGNVPPPTYAVDPTTIGRLQRLPDQHPAIRGVGPCRPAYGWIGRARSPAAPAAVSNYTYRLLDCSIAAL